MVSDRIDILKEWGNRLLSGKYQQGTGALCQSEKRGHATVKKYCCLGVLEELLSERGITKPMTPENNLEDVTNFTTYYYAQPAFSFENSRQHGWLSLEAQRFVGLNYNGGRLDRGDFIIDGVEYSSLGDANDSGRTFNKIGNAILAYVEELERD
jgi:hypothetical protein